MRIIPITLICVSVLATFNFCGSKTPPQDLTAPPGMTYLDISRTGMNVYVLVPDSSVGSLDTMMQSWGAYEIKRGKDFQISIEENNGDIENVKKDIAMDEVNKFKKYLIEEPNTLLWESGIGDLSEFHFYQVIKAGNRSYVIHDIKNDLFGQKPIEKMLEAAKQLKELHKESN